MVELLPPLTDTMSSFSPEVKTSFGNQEPVFVKWLVPLELNLADYALFVLEQEEKYCQQR
jgi:hypothetical protein